MWCFFSLFQTVQYTLVGSPPGTDFFTLSSTGQISVSKDLNTDPARLLSYQVSQSISQSVSQSVSQTLLTLFYSCWLQAKTRLRQYKAYHSVSLVTWKVVTGEKQLSQKCTPEQ